MATPAPIKLHAEREKKRESFRQDAIRAWEHYQATRMHVTADEVERWLSSWGAVSEAPVPTCHR